MTEVWPVVCATGHRPQHLDYDQRAWCWSKLSDDLDECAVCGWGAPPPPPPPSGQDVEGWIRALNAISCCGPNQPTNPEGHR